VKSGYSHFKTEEENLLLFGTPEDIQDYQREQIEYTFVIRDKADFELIQDQHFINLLGALEIKASLT
jgi:hypothetical protein